MSTAACNRYSFQIEIGLRLFVFDEWEHTSPIEMELAEKMDDSTPFMNLTWNHLFSFLLLFAH